MRKIHPKNKIIKVLKKHPDGLTLMEISRLSGMSRLTATKYIHELLGAGMIYQRKIGIAKLCYLKEKFIRTIKQEEVIEKLKKELK